MGKWSEKFKKYDLGEGLTLEKAENNREFSIFYNIYKDCNPFFRINWSENISIIGEDEYCFWIIENNSRIGGVTMEPNEIMGLFLIPPYSDLSNVLGKLVKLLLIWSDRSKKISTYTILSDQVEQYHRLGFKIEDKRRCMIRPTQEFNVTWDDKFSVELPKKEDIKVITELLYEAKIFGKKVQDKETDLDLKECKFVENYYSKNHDTDFLNNASTIIYDKETKEMIGVCLISLWSGLPNVFEIAVKPSYRGQSLAKKMLQHALSKLKCEYDLLRLFVTLGNPAENVYYKLGFLPGDTYWDLYIPAQVENK